MRRIHAFFMSKSRTVSAPRELIELSLIERFHWLPTDIAKIPYKTLQRFWVAEYEKDHSKGIITENESAKNRAKQMAQPGFKGRKRMIREI